MNLENYDEAQSRVAAGMAEGLNLGAAANFVTKAAGFLQTAVDDARKRGRNEEADQYQLMLDDLSRVECRVISVKEQVYAELKALKYTIRYGGWESGDPGTGG